MCSTVAGMTKAASSKRPPVPACPWRRGLRHRRPSSPAPLLRYRARTLERATRRAVSPKLPPWRQVPGTQLCCEPGLVRVSERLAYVGKQQRLHDKPVEDAHAEPLPVVRMVARDLGHSPTARVGQSHERPLVVFRRVEAERSLVAFQLDLVPQRTSTLWAFAGRLGFERVAQSLAELSGRHRRQPAEQADAWAEPTCRGRSSKRTSSARSSPDARARTARRARPPRPRFDRAGCRPFRSDDGRRRCTRADRPSPRRRP